MSQYVYFIGPKDRDIGLIKIGVSCDIRARLRSLQTASPFPLECYEYMEPDVMAPDVEMWLHKILAHKRASGEWFRMREQDIYEAVHVVANIMGFDFWLDDDKSIPPRVTPAP